MSVESDRNKSRAYRKGNVVMPETASDHSTMQNVFDFLQDYVPQAVSGPKEEKRDKVIWAQFETGDMNDPSLIHVCEASRENRPGQLSLLLVLGFTNGYSIWIIQPGGEAREVYCCFGDGEMSRTVRILKTPEIREGVASDSYADKRPIIAVVKKGRHSSSGGTVAYSTMQLVSLRAQDKDGGSVVRKCVFKTRPIVDIQCNSRVVAIIFQKRIVVLDAGSLENRIVIKNNYPSSRFPCNPIALGGRWLAYSETKLSSHYQSIGGISHTTPSYMATTMLKNVRKGISALTETISGLTTKEPADMSQQVGSVPSADVITVIDTERSFPVNNQEMKLQDLGKEGAVIAHFVAHTDGPNVHIAGLAFNPSGNLLLSASTEGHAFHVFQLLPHPLLSSETAVHHLYTLYRGATSGMVQDLAFSSDSRWVAVSTLNGTTHVFPLCPYGGESTMRTHTPSRVVNKMSQFRTSAGIDSIPNQSHSHNSILSAKSLVPKSGQSHVQTSQSPPQSNCRDLPSSSSSSIPSYSNGYNNNYWNNPRSLPLPTPINVTALQQVKQPYQPSSLAALGGVSGKGSISRGGGGGGGGGSAPSSSRVDPIIHSGEPYVTLSGPDVVCVRAVFGLPGDSGQGRHNTDATATYSLYVVGSNGVVTEHHLEPQKLPSAPEGEDAPIELVHYSKICWRLMGTPLTVIPGSIALPLEEDNPLIIANDAYKKHKGVKDSVQGSDVPPTYSSDDKWLSQVEILTHAPPSRRLWMGPQFTFKSYQSPLTSSSHSISTSASSTDLIKTPSPPNTIIYSGSLNSSSSTLHAVAMATGTGGGGVRTRDQTAVLFPSAENPLVDLFNESSEMHNVTLKSIDVNPIPISCATGGGVDGMELGQGSLDPGVLEVFGSWSKLAPHFEGAPFEGELEKQLQDAMGEQDGNNITVVATRDSRVKTGFSPPEL